jgi:hypothetical protein
MRDLQGRYAPFLDQRDEWNKRLVVALGLVVGVLAVIGLPELLRAFIPGNDVEIPLRAAERWASGGQPYPASALFVSRGPDMPFLYPPFVLPLIAPFSHLRHDVVSTVWVALTILAAVWACRRLGIPWLAVPFVLAWPPFAEGIISGNVQIMHFAAFVALLYVPGAPAPVQKQFVPARDLVNGAEAAAVGVLKVTQLLPVLYLVRRRFRAALFSVLALMAIFLIMLPFTGLGVYFDWLAQLQRVDDPSWLPGGLTLARLIGVPDVLLAAVGVSVALLVRGRDSAAWLGIALVVSAQSLHGYGFLFLLPGLMTIRRDLGIPLAALFLGNYHGYAWWLAVLIVSYLLAASNRWTWLRAPAGRGADLVNPGHGCSGGGLLNAAGRRQGERS